MPLKTPQPLTNHSDDTADALAIALTHAFSRKLDKKHNIVYNV